MGFLWVLSVSLLGDALLYIVLPINADLFGISIATMGFPLAVNRHQNIYL